MVGLGVVDVCSEVVLTVLVVSGVSFFYLDGGQVGSTCRVAYLCM